MRRTRFDRIGAVGLVCLVAVAVHAQQTIYVNGTTGNNAWNGLCEVWDGGVCGPKLTIQVGILAASPDDTVQVADGTYTGPENKNLDLGGMAITVRSANGPESCVIDCEGDGRGFVFRFGEGPDSIVEGFTIMGGYASGNDGGGAIYCYNASSPTIIECTISNNTAHQTGGSGLSGGGIYCRDGSSPTIADCTIIGNTAQILGGGVYCADGNLTITNCVITANTAVGSSGGGIAVHDGDLTIVNCTIMGNTASNAGGVRCGGGQLHDCQLCSVGQRGVQWTADFPRSFPIWPLRPLALLQRRGRGLGIRAHRARRHAGVGRGQHLCRSAFR